MSGAKRPNFGRLGRSLTGSPLLSEQEIVARSTGQLKQAGVYFLLRDNRVVYVGGSKNLFARVAAHLPPVRKERTIWTKDYDSFAYILCEPEQVDLLESLYIHALRPELNGGLVHNFTLRAPVSLDTLMAMAANDNEAAE